MRYSISLHAPFIQTAHHPTPILVYFHHRPNPHLPPILNTIMNFVISMVLISLIIIVLLIEQETIPVG
jgi:hypothetical protein